MPSTGKTTTASSAAVMRTGRPDRNSARPRSTATCLGVAKQAGLPTPTHVTPHYTRPWATANSRAWTRIRMRPSGLYSIAMSFSRRAFGSHRPAKYHGTKWQVPKAGIRRWPTGASPGCRISRPENGSGICIPPGRRYRQRFAAPLVPCPSPGRSMFGPLRQGAVDDLVVVGQCGQSLDGRIATADRTFPLHQRRRPASPTCTGCARWSTRWWSASARRSPTIRS